MGTVNGLMVNPVIPVRLKIVTFVNLRMFVKPVVAPINLLVIKALA